MTKSLSGHPLGAAVNAWQIDVDRVQVRHSNSSPFSILRLQTLPSLAIQFLADAYVFYVGPGYSLMSQHLDSLVYQRPNVFLI